MNINVLSKMITDYIRNAIYTVAIEIHINITFDFSNRSFIGSSFKCTIGVVNFLDFYCRPILRQLVICLTNEMLSRGKRSLNQRYAIPNQTCISLYVYRAYIL